VKELALKHGATDTTIRGTAIAELDSMSQKGSQVLDEDIPEKHWMYRIAKKFFYNDFGVYKNLQNVSEPIKAVPASSKSSPEKIAS
jgi:hypothetical protein